MRIKIRVKYNHGISAPEVDANLTVTVVRINAAERGDSTNPARSCG